MITQRDKIETILIRGMERLGLQNLMQANAADFVKWNEMTSFEVFFGKSCDELAEDFKRLVPKTEHHRLQLDRISHGGLLPWFYEFDHHVGRIKRSLPANFPQAEWRTGLTSLPRYAAECWLLDSGEYAILLDAGVVVFLDGAVTALLKHNAHLYADSDKLSSLQPSIEAFASDLMDWTLLMGKEPLSCAFSLHKQRGNGAKEYMLHWTFLSFFLGHELGHIYYDFGLCKSDPVYVRMYGKDIVQPIAWDEEYKADEFSFDLCLTAFGHGIMNALDVVMRLCILYSELFRLQFGGGTHPELGKRFLRLLDLADAKGVLKTGMRNTYIGNHTFWLRTVIDYLRANRIEDVNYLARVFHR